MFIRKLLFYIKLFPTFLQKCACNITFFIKCFVFSKKNCVFPQNWFINSTNFWINKKNVLYKNVNVTKIMLSTNFCTQFFVYLIFYRSSQNFLRFGLATKKMSTKMCEIVQYKILPQNENIHTSILNNLIYLFSYKTFDLAGRFLQKLSLIFTTFFSWKIALRKYPVNNMLL